MLISGKLHSRVKSRNSRASVETLDFAQVCTFFRRDRSWIASGGTRGGDRRLVPDAVPSRCGDPIDRSTWQAVARPKRHKTARGGGGGRAWESLSPPCRMPLDNWSTSQEDGCAKLWTAAVSPAPWHTCQNAGMERSRGRDRRPAARPAVGCSRTIGRNLSALSCFL